MAGADNQPSNPVLRSEPDVEQPATTSDVAEPARLSLVQRAALLGTLFAIAGVLATIINNLYVAVAQRPTISARYQIETWQFQIFLHHKKSRNFGANISIPVTYFNNGNRAFVVESVSLSTTPAYPSLSCKQRPGSVIAKPMNHPASTEFETGPDTIPSGTPSSIRYSFLIDQDFQPDSKPYSGTLCLGISASAIDGRKVVLEIPLAGFSLQVDAPALFASPDAMDGKPKPLF